MKLENYSKLHLKGLSPKGSDQNPPDDLSSLQESLGTIYTGKLRGRPKKIIVSASTPSNNEIGINGVI